MASDQTMYDQLGGREAIEAVVDEFYRNVLSDEKLQPYFEDVNTEELREHQKDFISYITGGYENYGGMHMYEAHAHLDITNEAFDRVANHLDASLQTHNVPDHLRTELLSKVDGLRAEVVTE